MGKAPIHPSASGRRPRRRDPGLIALGAALLLTIAGAVWTEWFRPLPDPFKPVTGGDWWFTPIEHNAFMRMTAIDAALYAVYALRDTDLVWAVGDWGMVVRSRDGGRTWQHGRIVTQHVSEPSETAPRPEAPSNAPAPNAPKAAPAATDPRKLELHGVLFFDELRGVAVGEHGAVIFSQDGGKTWSPRPTPYRRRGRNLVALRKRKRPPFIRGSLFQPRTRRRSRRREDLSERGRWQEPGSSSLPALPLTLALAGELRAAHRRGAAMAQARAGASGR